MSQRVLEMYILAQSHKKRSNEKKISVPPWSAVRSFSAQPLGSRWSGRGGEGEPHQVGSSRAGPGRAAPGRIQLVLFVFFRLAARGAAALPRHSVGGAPAGPADTVASLTKTQGASLRRPGSAKHR